MARFPDVQALAAAPLDEVLHLWSGLGYYARARNLQRAAIRVCAEHGGRAPAHLRGARRPARHRPLDRGGDSGARQRRALSRFWTAMRGACWRATSASPAERRMRQCCKKLWQLAEEQTPAAEVAAYTQAHHGPRCDGVRAAPAAVSAVSAAARLQRAPQRAAARDPGAAPRRRAPPAQCLHGGRTAGERRGAARAPAGQRRVGRPVVPAGVLDRERGRRLHPRFRCRLSPGRCAR